MQNEHVRAWEVIFGHDVEHYSQSIRLLYQLTGLLGFYFLMRCFVLSIMLFCCLVKILILFTVKGCSLFVYLFIFLNF